MDRITDTLQRYIDQNEISGAVLLVRKDGKLVYDQTLGYSDIKKQRGMDRKNIFRLASMTKPITGIAIMQLIETNKLGLYDAVAKFIPEFQNMMVAAANGTDPIPAKRNITIFDLLTHSSGICQGELGIRLSAPLQGRAESTLSRSRKYAELPLDFQPGEGSGYSPVAGFEVLTAILEIVTGQEFEEYLKKNIFTPLNIIDLGFSFRQMPEECMVSLCEYTENGILTDVSDTDPFWQEINYDYCGFKSGAAGLVGSVVDYEKICNLLLNKGTLDGVRILKTETVEMMAGQNIPHTSVMMPGTYWGLSMLVFDEPQKRGFKVAPGTFGWSGAFGTHMYIDFQNHLDVVLGLNRSNIGGAVSPISRAVEVAVTETFL